ncbi:hypothetical protein J7J35_03285 [Candidatus Bipolaricaulota bacterium]|nr:hypothetical protein [Candidatus Bipolaricaulota bacterium]
MEEHEVDLRDYLRVLWRGKWIVLATFLVAVGVAAVVSFKAPDVFRAEARLTVEKPQGLSFSYSPPSPDIVVEWAQDPGLLTQALAMSGENRISSAWISSHLHVKKQGSFVDLSLEGTLEPARLQGLLQGVVAALKARGEEDVKEALAGALSSLSSRRAELSRKLAVWEEELSRVRDRAETQREEILARISELTENPARNSIPLGDQITVEGYRVMKELDLLYARLQAVQLELDELARLGVYALPNGAREYASLKEELAALETEEDELQRLLSKLPSPLVTVRGPAASPSPVGPNRKMNLAVAGVLGLFCGVLLAFFAYYLKGEGSQPPHDKGADQPPEPPGDKEEPNP